MKSLRVVLSIPVLLAIVLTLFGCGATPTAAPTTAPPQAAAPTAVPATPVPAPMTMTFCAGADAVRLDPADLDDEPSWLPVDHIFEGLTVVKDTSGQPQPALAERWEASADLKEWTFYLRKGVTFSDGTPLNAESYLWNIYRQWDPSHPYADASKYATLGYYLFVDYFALGKKGDANAGLQEVQQIDEYTIKFVLKDPNPLFLQYTHVVPFEAVGKSSFETYDTEAYQHPVGTGPYVLEEWIKDDHLTLVRNPNYWDKASWPLDKIVFKIIPDASARLLAVKAGDCQGMNLVSPDDAAAAAGDPNLQITLRPPANVGYVRFNMSIAPLDDLNVRLALAHATDRQSIVDNLYSGLGKPAEQWMGPLYPGHNPDVKGYPFDLEKAKGYLKAAGLEDGFTIDFWYMPVARPYFPNAKVVAEAIAADWAKIGVIANLQTEDWGQYKLDLAAGKLPIFMFGWTPDYIDGSLLDVWFKDVPLGSGSQSQCCGFANEEVNDLLIQAGAILDEDERIEMYQRVAVIVNEIVPGVPIVHTSVPNIFSAKVQGFVPVPLKTDILRGVSIAK